MTHQRALKLLAPYLAVGIFWCGLSNGWLAILAYHFQILFWQRRARRTAISTDRKSILLLALPAILAGPLIFLLLPSMTRTALVTWLAEHQLSHLSLGAMIPYFAFIHPWLEQRHWAPLRNETPLAHPLFAGYHLLVLYTLLTVPWLVVSFVVLAGASVAWQLMGRKFDSLALPVASHILADLGIIMAAWIRM